MAYADWSFLWHLKTCFLMVYLISCIYDMTPLRGSTSWGGGIYTLGGSRYGHILIYSYTHILIYSYTHIIIYIFSYTHILIYSYTHILINSYTLRTVFMRGRVVWRWAVGITTMERGSEACPPERWISDTPTGTGTFIWAYSHILIYSYTYILIYLYNHNHIHILIYSYTHILIYLYTHILI
jgi:hypothetical protein